jgi:hypothetical protein
MNDHSSSRKPAFAAPAAAVLCLLFLAQVFFGSRSASLTWDEPSFIAAGYSSLTTGSLALNPSHPPLMQEMAALPLVLAGFRFPPPDPETLAGEINPVVAYGAELVYGSGSDARTIALLSRLPVMLIGTGLIAAIFAWGRKLYGDGPALVGTAVAALSPNLVAHGQLATEDMGCTALMFVAVWMFWESFHDRSRRRYAIACGIVTGLAFLSKYTALLLVPVYGILAFLFVRRDPERMSPLQAGRTVAAVLGLAAAVVLLRYRSDVLLYARGIAAIYGDMSASTMYYLLGAYSRTTWWYYYLVAFVLKTPIPALLLLLLAAGALVRDRDHREASLTLLVPAAVVVGVACFDRANLGLRRILPALPFLALFASQAVAGERRKLRFAALLLIVWMAVDALAIYPHHLSFFNGLVGGPEKGPYLLDDSNIDWGQDLPALAEWQRMHPEARPIKLYYFGVGDVLAARAYGVDAVSDFPDGEFEHPRAGTYAVSVTNLVLLRHVHQATGRDTDWLARFRPAGRAGYSIYIYQFPRQQGKRAPAERHEERRVDRPLVS